ncbi:MAG: Hydrogenase-4 component E [Burkholderiaceae bacterium]|jgi:hydrogenase-4 component E|nr:MAG: Hydrogenase-4 component E [Burkholderiaceae bacterium]
METYIALNGFIAALFVILGLGVIVTRQMLGTLHLFMLHAVALTASALVLGLALHSPHLFWVAAITFSTKVVAVPLVLVWTAGSEIYERREVDQVLTIPVSVLIAAVLALVAWVTANPLVHAISDRPFAAINLPTGLMAVFFGAFTVAVRREAVAQLMGILIMESGAFFASISIVNELSIIAEIAAAVDVPVVALVIGLLIRSIRSVTGMTRVGLLAELKEHR